ncbi:SpoIID/LytB domain-containing protein [Paenibacillus sp. 1011MAR3C5]|uniref:family 10 glycosylhydrolase n=1 Tax=Paenibacillus sp. 1011MAR3C5 TaxID=1675787 RepID=UPI000E6D3DEB|nr:family 10 glycosylhydrolase [Paenibacillus sp. 1011MAR3C5]RJE89717.1 SpoIID/LytB domain-containing protein [Paenibacillus sp. 1011MAR3C5]
MYLHRKTNRNVAILIVMMMLWGSLFSGMAYAAEEQSPADPDIASETAPDEGEEASEPAAMLPLAAAAADHIVIEDFEDISDLYVAEVRTVPGSTKIEQSTRPGPVMYGQASGKFDYDFTGNEGTSAAYLHFNKNEDRVLEGYPVRIGAWVYGDGGKHWLRAQFEDATGVRHTSDFTSTGGFSWTGWQYVTASVPQGLPQPIELRQIYIAETNNLNKNKGTVYFDQVSAIYTSGNPAFIELSGLTEMKPGDSLQAAVLATSGGSSTRADVTSGSMFNSSSTDVATVSASGLVQAVAVGTTTITATNGSNKATYELIVSDSGAVLAGLELEGRTALNTGETEQLRAYAFYSGQAEPVHITEHVTYASSDEAIAVVSSTGLLTAKNEGAVTITAELEGLTATIDVIITKPVPVLQGITIAGLIPLTEGDKAQANVLATYTLLDEEVNVTDNAVFTSSDPTVAEVDADGQVTAKKAGTTRIRATFEDKLTEHLLIVHAPQQLQKRELRAAWIASVENIDWPTKGVMTEEQQKSDFIALLDELAATGINAVIVQIKPTADAFYPSEYAPWSEWLTGEQGKDPGYDPLAFMLEEAHKRNMEFHAWFNPYRISMHADISKLVDDHPAKKNPDWVVSYGGKLYFNPGVPEAKQFVIDSVMEVVDNYDIDAVHFDDYFYPYPATGVDFPDAAEYAAYGKDFADKAAWRRNNVDTLIQGLATAIKESKPYVQFGISPFGIWRNKTTDVAGSDTNGLQSYDALYADTKGWVDKGWLDYIAPQDYWHFGNGPAAYEKVVEWWRGVTADADTHLYIGHAIYRVPTWDDPLEMVNQIKFNRSFAEDIQGSMFFSAKDVIANHLGMQDTMMNDLYRFPALAPTMPWLDDTAPAAPKLNAAELSEEGVAELRFTDADGSQDTTYYAIYRQEGTAAPDINNPSQLIGTFRKQAGAAEQLYVDGSMDEYKTYTYAVTALDRLHNESTVSNAVTLAYTPGDTLKEKVMAKDSKNGTIELERSGVLKLAANAVIEQKFPARTVTRLLSEVLVGAENAVFTLNDKGEISKITLNGETPRDTMRVGIRNSIADITDMTQLNHTRIEMLATASVSIADKIGGKNIKAEANAPIVFTIADGKTVVEQKGKVLLSTENRIYLMPPADGSLIEISSLTRAQGKPKYRGVLEVFQSPEGDKLRIVNELNMEQYLYQVVPSEMPASFGLEALKAQSIAARTYALTDYMVSRFADQGFHIDDSTLSQVFNNSAENELTHQAVDATAGLIMLSDGMLVDARFYSTSGGYGASKHEVWADTGTNKFPGTAIPYLTARSYTFDPNSDDMLNIDTSDEAAVNAFYKDLSLTGYDSESLFFRWKVALTAEQLAATINKNIKLRHAADPLFILTKTDNGSFASLPIPEDGIGELLGMSVAKRGAGGNITELIIEGTTGTYKIMKEYNIRFTIRPTKADTGSMEDILAYRAKGGSTDYDGAGTVKNPSILYSAFFTFDIKAAENGAIESVTFYGGGNGHGVGMSQYGAQMLGKEDWTYSQILNAYYANMNIVSLNAPLITSLEAVNPARLSIGAAGKLTVNGLFSNGDKSALTAGIDYQSSDSSIVSVDASGNLKALKAGEATITITVGALSTTAKVQAYRSSVDPGNPGNPGEPGGGDGDGGGTDPEPKPEPSIDFSDIGSHWAKASIEEAVKRGIVMGYEDGTFRPQAQVTRAQFITLLMRAFDGEISRSAAPAFKDSSDIPDWAMASVKKAVAAGLITGYDDGTFRPGKAISRSEMTALIVRIAGLEPIEDANLSFSDSDSIGDWARGYIAAAVEAGLMQGKGNNRFAPNDRTTRAEAVVLLLAWLNESDNE